MSASTMPTPRTDAQNFGECCATEFCRTLEQELAKTERLRFGADADRRLLRAELERERTKARLLRDACESICEEWGNNHDTNPIGAGRRMSTIAGNALEKAEDAT